MTQKKPDRLSALIKRFRVEAKVLPAGLSGGGDPSLKKGTAGGNGAREEDPASIPNLFLLRRGALSFPDGEVSAGEGQGPILVFFPRGLPSPWTFLPDQPDAEYVCARIDTGGDANPIALALPDRVILRLDEVPSIQPVTDLLLHEALSPRCGGGAVIDRLCEILVIQLLRHFIEAGQAEVGLLAGLADPNLSLAIVAIHEKPHHTWRLEALAETAAMSRTHFANSFRIVVGVTPGEYLSSWRLALARVELSKGTPLKAIAGKVGFSSSAALSRAFSRRYGVSPKQALSRSA